MDYLLSILAFSLFVMLAWGLGRKILDICGYDFNGALERFVFSFGIGYGLISYVILLLGIGKVLYGWLVITISAICGLVVLPEINISIKEIFVWAKGLKKQYKQKRLLRPFGPRNDDFSIFSIELIILILIGIVVVLGLFAALAPSYSNDSMVYHLTDAKYFASIYSVENIPNNSSNALWPYLVEMYYTFTLLINLLPMAGLFHYSLAIAAMIGVYALSKRFFSGKLALIASAIFILTPGIFMETKETYVDLGMVFFTLLAFYTFSIWRAKGKNRWAALSGIMCGLTMSVKFFGVVTFLIVGSLFLARNIKQKKAIFSKSVILFALCAIVASSIWYIRQYIVFKNPLFPYYPQIFGSGRFTREAIDLLSEGNILRSFNKDNSIAGIITMPWKLTMHPKEFGGEQIGPIFLAILPGLILLRPIDKNLKPIVSFAFIYAVVWFFIYQNLRFFLPAIPFLSIAAAYVLCAFIKKGVFSKIVLASALVFFVISASLSFYHCSEAVAVVLGMEGKSEYLNRNERSFCISAYINKELPRTVKVLVINEGHTFFMDRVNKRELYYWLYTQYDSKFRTPDEVIAFFRSEGFTHILYAQKTSAVMPVNDNIRLTDLIEREYFRDRYLKQVYEVTPHAKNAEDLKYILYEIKK